MRGVQCGVCRSVWMSPAAHRLVDMSGGCLRCDGALHLLTEEETATALHELDTRDQHRSAPPQNAPGDR